jgi:hypothetical protein
MDTTPGLLAIHVRPGHPDFLDLPWDRPLAAWEEGCPRWVNVQRGLSRHDVVFVGYPSAIYALKQLPGQAAEREYELLRQIGAAGLPAVEAVGHTRVRAPDPDDPEAGVLVTRYLEASLPYRTLFMSPGLERYRERLMDAMAGLLVRLHLAGFYWGDCSLSNTLFRRDAGELQAFLVDAETAERHEPLADGLRRQDLEILEENVTGDLADLAAHVQLPPTLDVYGTAGQIRGRYERLWAEIGREVTVRPEERYRIHERIGALNDLGFTVDEVALVATGQGDQLRMRTIVTDRDYHRHMLHSLTGIVAGDRQAALMLNEIRELQATLAREQKTSVPMSIAAHRWLEERFKPVMQQLAPLLEPLGDPAELYCQALEHKWYLSERARRDVGLEVAVEDYLKSFRRS